MMSARVLMDLFENLVNQECRKTVKPIIFNDPMFENLVNQECRKTLSYFIPSQVWFENLVNQECRKTGVVGLIILR